jgi:hypothetical protein
MRLLPYILALALAVPTAVLAQSGPSESVTLGDIEVRLFYKETGRLSENILGRKTEFVFHNAVIGEGDAEEAADDILVSVRMSAGKFGTAEDNHKYVDAPVEIIARDGRGKVLGRRIHQGILTSYKGSEHKVLWLNDVTCAGEVTITATYAGKSKSARLVMGCGE